MHRCIAILTTSLLVMFTLGWGLVAAQAAILTAPPAIKIIAPANGTTLKGERIVLTIAKSNFTFDPAATNNPAVVGRGNYRVFIDDQFAGMDFGAVTSLPNDVMPRIKAGQHRLAVRLYNRDNTPYAGAQGDEISINLANAMNYAAAPGQPSIQIVGKPQADGHDHFVIQAKIAGYKLAPDLINKPPQPGIGHYHVYVDGNKLANVGVSEISSIPSDLNPDPNLLTPGQHTVTLVLETHQHVPIAGGSSQPVTFTVTAADLSAHDPSLATTLAGMNMDMATPSAAPTGIGAASPSAVATLTPHAAPVAPTSDSDPSFGLWLLVIVGVGAIIVLGQSLFRRRPTTANPAAESVPLPPTAQPFPPSDEC